MSEDLSIDGVDPSVGFLYKTMLQRDPRKRRVKPVQKHLIQIDFGGLDDSDDDSDFEVGKHVKGSDSGSDISIKEEEEDGDSDKSVSGSELKYPGAAHEPSDDDEDDDDEDDEEDDSATLSSLLGIPSAEKLKPTNAHLFTEKSFHKCPDSQIDPLQTPITPSATPIPTKAGQIKVLICCVCLGDISEEDDEIVECDNCGVSVHEGCYGISDNQSAASTESSASTEPWFCDACKAGVKPSCELCPNYGGIFKETDAGKWVHLVCALYTPGVAFGDVDRLSAVTLFEMPYARWGAKECSLCEDSRFSRTGVCISCDAGMCRAYFHVTCAQREGLLAEAPPEEVMDIADPFFAYCKMHADKTTARAKRRNWLAIQSHVKMHSEKEIEDEKEKARFQRKLNRRRQKYLLAKARSTPSWVPTQKLIRHLSSSPSVVKKMLRKAEFMGIITQIQNVSQDKQESRKKWHMSPALSLEFISYYLDRNARMDTMKINMKELSSQNDKLQEQQKVLRVQYDQLLNEINRLKDSTSKMQQNGEETWGILTDLSGQELNIPEMFRVRKSPRSPTKRETHPKSPPAPPIQQYNLLIGSCGICKKSTDQHLLAKCDSCSKHYHLGCLDPPLSRMPKKTKLQGWQCSECASSSSDVSEETGVDVDAPRKLREKIKEPIKFEQLQSLDMKSEKRLRNRANPIQKKGKRRKSMKMDKGSKREDHEDSEGVMEL